MSITLVMTGLKTVNLQSLTFFTCTTFLTEKLFKNGETTNASKVTSTSFSRPISKNVEMPGIERKNLSKTSIITTFMNQCLIQEDTRINSDAKTMETHSKTWWIQTRWGTYCTSLRRYQNGWTALRMRTGPTRSFQKDRLGSSLYWFQIGMRCFCTLGLLIWLVRLWEIIDGFKTLICLFKAHQSFGILMDRCQDGSKSTKGCNLRQWMVDLIWLRVQNQDKFWIF